MHNDEKWPNTPKTLSFKPQNFYQSISGHFSLLRMKELTCHYYLTRKPLTLKNNDHCVKYPRIQFFCDPYFPVYLRFCSYMEKYGSEKTRILEYFTQWVPFQWSN